MQVNTILKNKFNPNMIRIIAQDHGQDVTKINPVIEG